MTEISRPGEASLSWELRRQIPPRHIGSGFYKHFGVSICEGSPYRDANGNAVPTNELELDLSLEGLVEQQLADEAWIENFRTETM
ncbi:MAG: hypothetical protein ACREGC_02550 [Minisyncoccia bacterium]